jgi:hypothetical protein
VAIDRRIDILIDLPIDLLIDRLAGRCSRRRTVAAEAHEAGVVVRTPAFVVRRPALVTAAAVF